MSFRPLFLSLLVAPLFLTACGEGYEPILTDEYFPYGNQRTAGSGVAYVLAKMMPEKELKLEPVAETKQTVVEEVSESQAEEVVEDSLEETSSEEAPAEETPMEEVFQDAQKK